MITNYEFLKKWQKMQHGVEYDKLMKLGKSILCYTESNPDMMANYALVKIPPDKQELDEIENYFSKLMRPPTIYMENLGHKIQGYEKRWEDSWMFFNNTNIDKAGFEKVKIVDSENELEIFLDIFDKCFQKDDLQNPYGEVKNYIVSTRNAWKKYRDDKRLEYYLAYEKDEPVATAMLDVFQGLGYIACVGSLQKVRGQGFGKLVTLFAVDRSIALGNTEHTLATEEGTYPNEFYIRIGFKTRFSAIGWGKIS